MSLFLAFCRQESSKDFFIAIFVRSLEMPTLPSVSLVCYLRVYRKSGLCPLLKSSLPPCLHKKVTLLMKYSVLQVREKGKKNSALN